MGTFVTEYCRFTQRQKAMREALGDIELPVIISRKLYSIPSAKAFAALAQIYRHIEYTALKHTGELSLRVLLLIMQATQHTSFALALIFLYELHIQTGGFELTLMIDFTEISTFILKHSRLNDYKPLDGRFDKIDFCHIITPILSIRRAL